jgi:hypothetical protein
MRASVGKDQIVFTCESEFEVAALKQWEGRASHVIVETYANKGYYTTGYLKIEFKTSLVPKPTEVTK